MAYGARLPRRSPRLRRRQEVSLAGDHASTLVLESHRQGVPSRHVDPGWRVETATELVGPVFDELEQGLVADVARALRTAGIADRWKPAGVSAKDLAEHLYVTSYGVKHRVATHTDYRDRMRLAVRIVCRGPAR